MSLPPYTVLRAEVSETGPSRAQAVEALEQLIEPPWRISPLDDITVAAMATVADGRVALWEARTTIATTHGELLEALGVAR